jgi:hypothetical protein
MRSSLIILFQTLIYLTKVCVSLTLAGWICCMTT